MATMRLENRTPHPITMMWRASDGIGMRRFTIPPTMPTPRVDEARRPGGAMTVETDGFPVALPINVMVAAGAAVTSLPDPVPGVVYVVSRMVCEARPGPPGSQGTGRATTGLRGGDAA